MSAPELKEWLIFSKSHQLFYCADYSGYTGIRDNAGRYTEAEAKSRCALSDDLNALHESEAVEFTIACYEDLKLAHVMKQREALTARVKALDDENERIRDALTYMVNFYDEMNPMRTADMHQADCTCTRCVVDGFRAALSREGE